MLYLMILVLLHLRSSRRLFKYDIKVTFIWITLKFSKAGHFDQTLLEVTFTEGKHVIYFFNEVLYILFKRESELLRWGIRLS